MSGNLYKIATAVFLLVGTSVQQESNSTDECLTGQNGPFNATGMTEFTGFTPPNVQANNWYFSVGFTDIRRGDSNNQFYSYYISTPTSQNFSSPQLKGLLQVYRGINSDIDEDRPWDSSCDDIISQGCQDAIVAAGRSVAQGRAGSDDDSELDSSGSLNPGRHTECQGDSNFASTASFGLSPGGVCALEQSPPGISPPANYRTAFSGGSSNPPVDSSPDVFEQYSAKIQQTTPYLIATWGTDEGSTYADVRLFCGRTDQIAEGSRTPDREEGGAGRMSVGWGWAMGLVAAGVAFWL